MEDQTQNTDPKTPEAPKTETKAPEAKAETKASEAKPTARPIAQPADASSSGSKTGLIVGIIIAIIAIIIICIIVFVNMGTDDGQRVNEGQLENKTQEEIQAELDRDVEEGMLSISINSYMEMQNGDEEAELRIENSPANNYKMKVDIVLQDTNELIYESDILEPNSHIQSDKLLVDLEPGSYTCIAKFYALDLETDEVVGQANAQIFIDVLN